MAQTIASRQSQKLGQSKAGAKRKRADKEAGDEDSPKRIQNIPTHKSPSAATAPSHKEAHLRRFSYSTSRSTSPYINLPPSGQGSYQSSDLTPYLKKIALSTLTPFQKRVLTALCQVPPGEYTTYGVLAKHLSSSPRAVGNALRGNPFAPQVPCHRVLASGGGLGGFKGSWGRGGEKGKNDDLKINLLRDEGVLFGSKGLVIGGAWEGFK